MRAGDVCAVLSTHHPGGPLVLFVTWLKSDLQNPEYKVLFYALQLAGNL